MNINGIARALTEMVGVRQRCVYCLDSIGTNIEHHRPKHRYPATMFVWNNLLIACTSCNQRKGRRFPIDPSGAALLIDPTACDPWEHLFLVHETGELTPRIDPETGAEDPLGVATTDPTVLPVNKQPIATARARAWKALRREVQHFLSAPGDAAAAALEEAFRETERPDVAIWVLAREGRQEAPFSVLCLEHTDLVVRLLAAAW